TFYAAIKTYWPAIPEGSLEPAYSGVRPKINGPGEPAADFAIHAQAEPGVPRVAQLFGIESPGLTASLAIGAHVPRLLATRAGSGRRTRAECSAPPSRAACASA